jgi:hypothetical protein
VRGAALQQAVGEAAGRGAGVGAAQARGIDAERVEGARELLAPARNVRAARDQDGLRVGGDKRARLVDHAIVEPHIAGEDARRRAAARALEPELEQTLVQAHPRLRQRATARAARAPRVRCQRRPGRARRQRNAPPSP